MGSRLVLFFGQLKLQVCVLITHTFDILCNALPDAWCTLALAVCAHALDFLQ